MENLSHSTDPRRSLQRLSSELGGSELAVRSARSRTDPESLAVGRWSSGSLGAPKPGFGESRPRPPRGSTWTCVLMAGRKEAGCCCSRICSGLKSPTQLVQNCHVGGQGAHGQIPLQKGSAPRACRDREDGEHMETVSDVQRRCQQKQSSVGTEPGCG